MRKKIQFANNEFYHVCNRGVDKRSIFSDQEDVFRFFQSMEEFNVVTPIGSLYLNSFDLLRGQTPKPQKLVNFVAYCLNPNHYHFILEQLVDKGISEFMKRLGGYSWYFNNKYKRSGALLQGRYKAIHIESNEYLLHVSAYVNLNNKVHGLDQLGGQTPKLTKSSWGEYVGQENSNFCEKDIVLDQFKGLPSKDGYVNFAENSLLDIRERKEMKKMLLD